MNNNIKVLKFFADNKEGAFSIRQVSKLLKMSYKLVYEQIIKLDKTNHIKTNFIGRAKVCKFNYKYDYLIVNVEEERQKELFKNKDIQLIYRRIKDIKKPFFILLVFGSFANKTNKKNSDIDLCLIADNKKINKLVNEVLSITPVNVHLNEFTTDEFMSMLLTTEENVAHEIIKNNIILCSIENFYEMVNNVE